MKLFASVIALSVAMGGAVAATTTSGRIVPDGKRGYNVTFETPDVEKRGWYMTGRLELSFLNWENKYTVPQEYVLDSDGASDSYSFQQMFGGGISFGKRFQYFWRADVEGGYIGSFSDKDAGYEFQLSAAYLTANIYRDFIGGFYLGAGLGGAMITTALDSEAFVDYGNHEKQSLGVMGALMLGYSAELSEDIALDIRYRFAALTGGTHTRTVQVPGATYDFETKIGFIMDNSLSLGLRYQF